MFGLFHQLFDLIQVEDVLDYDLCQLVIVGTSIFPRLAEVVNQLYGEPPLNLPEVLHSR